MGVRGGKPLRGFSVVFDECITRLVTFSLAPVTWP